MTQLIVSGVLIFLAIIFFVVGRISYNSDMKFETNKRIGTARIVGYANDGRTGYGSLLVNIIELNDEKVYTCAQGVVKKINYPKGKIVGVEYIVEKIMGLVFVQVKLIENKRNIDTFMKLMNKLALILLIIAAIIMLSYLIKII